MNRFFLILLAVLIIGWFLFGPIDQKMDQPNIITKTTHSSSVIKPNQKHQLSTLKQNQKPSQTFGEYISYDQSSEFSYLGLYKEFRQAEFCLFNSKSIDGEGINTFKQEQLNRFEQTSEESGQPISVTQIELYQQHLNQCIQLFQKHKDDLNQYESEPFWPFRSDLVLLLSDKLLTEPAKTEKEKQLKSLRKLIQPWNDAWQTLINTSKGIVSPEAKQTKEKLDELNYNWQLQTRQTGFEITDEIRSVHWENIKTLREQLKQIVAFDSQAKEQAWQIVLDLVAKIAFF